MLSDCLEISERDESTEDIFESAISAIFPDEVPVCHGDSESQILYRSPKFGDFRLSLAEPHGESNRKLFAHYLWNAALMIAELISSGTADQSSKNCMDWHMNGEHVIELGAG